MGEATGWTWTARVRPGLYQWTRLTWEKADLDRSWLPPEFVALTPRGFTRGADVTWRIVDEMAGKGYFMVGDAAAVLDPTASNGVLKAIMSGLMAGDAISNISRNRLCEEQRLNDYKKWLSGWFWTDVYHLQRFYMSLVSHPIVQSSAHQPA